MQLVSMDYICYSTLSTKMTLGRKDSDNLAEMLVNQL